MTQHMSHEEYVAEQKARAVNIATQMLDGKTGIIEGARLLWRLQSEVTDQDFDADFLIFILIVSETDGLPIGPERELWATSALIEKDKQVEHAQDLYREEALASCKALVERFRAA
jgi:hypothetical protein